MKTNKGNKEDFAYELYDKHDAEQGGLKGQRHTTLIISTPPTGAFNLFWARSWKRSMNLAKFFQHAAINSPPLQQAGSMDI